MIATMRGACLVGVLVIVIGCLTETRAYVSFDQVNPDNSSVSDDHLLGSADPEQEAKAKTEKPNLTRVPLEPRKSRRAIDGSLATINENDGEKPARVAIKDRPVPEEVAPKARPGAKRNHKKMKLTQTQSQKKSKKTKRYIDISTSQKLNANQNHSETVRANRYKDSKYYAERKAIMDRFYARNSEIIKKYQRRTTMTTTTTTEGPFKYNLGFEGSRTPTGNDWFAKEAKTKPPIASPPPQVLTRTIPSTRSFLETTEDNGTEEEEIDETTELTPTITTTTEHPLPRTKKSKTTTTERAEPGSKPIQRVGNCDNLESLDEVYQHNLILDIERSTIVETVVSPPMVEGSCVDCVIVHQTSGPLQNIIGSSTSKEINIRVEGVENGLVAISVKFYTNSNKGDRC